MTDKTRKRKLPEPREVEIVKPDYQPSAAELAEDTRVNATFDEAVEALTKPVAVRYVERPDDARSDKRD